MRGRRAVVAVLAGVGLASVVLVSAPSAVADLGDAAPEASKPRPIPADPTPMQERMQWMFVLRWSRGEVYLVAIRKTDMGNSHPTARVMGRFALELFEGPTLIERVRFDFPGLGGDEPPDAAIRITPKLDTRIGVFFPATKRGTRLELWDRATDRRWPLPWPPVEGTFSDSPPDGGIDASGPIPSK